MKETPNLKYLDDLAEGDEVFRQKFIAILKVEFPMEREEYQQSISGKLYREASEHVHKIKHKLNVLGLHNAYTLAVQYENQLRKGDNLLEKEFLSVMDKVEAYLKTI
ncbi:Hpt domain-containing protein [Allomuricauda sp. M10]|uniref:Hpt domain-containing protein n=1 Tax=Allomuricauda sp. M10 TaxID=2683292 RepID=UPI001D180FC2|nr:Hpt domain-containing protein [Muricauda sp. M10]